MATKNTSSIRVDVESSVISQVEYCDRTHSMLVHFNSGSVYVYDDVPQTIFDILVNSESVGKYFNAAIKGCYEFERVA